MMMNNISANVASRQPVDPSMICQTCELPFNETNRAPRAMPCGHNYCSQCLSSAFDLVKTRQLSGMYLHFISYFNSIFH